MRFERYDCSNACPVEAALEFDRGNMEGNGAQTNFAALEKRGLKHALPQAKAREKTIPRHIKFKLTIY